MLTTEYFIAGDVLIVDGRHEDFRDAIGGSSRVFATDLPERWFHTGATVDTKQQASCILSYMHEFQHHMDLQATSYGLLVWRTQRIIAADVLTTLRAARYAGMEFPRDIPFPAWLDSISTNLQKTARGLDVDAIASALRALLRFRRVLLGEPELVSRHTTFGDAVDIANAALPYLRGRSDLDSTWSFTTDHPPDDRIDITFQVDGSSPWVGTGRSMLESSAWFAEVKFLKLCPEWIRYWRFHLGGADRATFLRVDEQSDINDKLLGVYFPVLDYGFGGFGDPALPADGDVPLESLLPQWRVADALQWLLHEQGSDPFTLLSNDPVWGGEAACQAVYEALAKANLVGPNGWGTDLIPPKDWTAPFMQRDPDVRFFPYRLREYRRAFVARTRKPSSVAFPLEHSEGLFHQPLLEFYEDDVKTNLPSSDPAYAGYLYESALVEYICTEGALSLCDRGQPLDTLGDLLERYERMCAKVFEESNKAPPDIRASLRESGLPGWTFERP